MPLIRGDHRRGSVADRLLHAVLGLAVMAPLVMVLSVADAGVAAAQPDPCAAPVTNEVACENTRPGTAGWQALGTSEAITGYPTDISVAAGETVDFKIETDAPAYQVDVFRLGWYGGTGARQVASLPVPVPAPQPECLRDATGLADCGNWSVSVSWPVPSAAVSGLYYARLTRADDGAQNEIVFVVRNDASTADIAFQTSDSTWQAYNRFGGASLYTGDGPGKDGSAFKVSYNRPILLQNDEDFIFNAEYPMLRFLERNGYDLTYTTNVDTVRRGDLITNHKVFMAVGHDEYWSNEQRANVEAARDAGVHLAFLTGNEIFWKTRWEPSIDGSGTPLRTVVSYKETKSPQVDPSPEWTGTWRDPRFSPPKDGGRPENALLGNMFTVNGRRDDSLQVPAEHGRMRLWRHTDLSAMPSGSTYTFQPGTLGYEWNTVEDNGFQPPGVAQLSRTTVDLQGPFALQNHGDVYGSAIKTHALTLYRHPSGSLVFGAGTVQWAWGVDDEHAYLTGNPTSDPRMQQATVNLLADMGVQPVTLQAELVRASASTDTEPPTVAVAAGDTPRVGVAHQVSGTVTDQGGGQVAGVEVSTDGGARWHPAVWQAGQAEWSYTYTPAASGPATFSVRAVDDSANLGSPVSAPLTVSAPQCPCSIWPDTAVPAVVDTADDGPIELGVKWQSADDGFVRGIRFYKSAANTGTHTGSLWTAAGQRLATGTFVDETASGWQTLLFPSPVAVMADTTYVVSYHAPVGRYSADVDHFTVRSVAQEPLTALRSGIAGPNGLYRSGSSGFPTQSFRDSNYWVDVVWAPDPGPDTRAPLLTATTPVAGAGTVSREPTISATFDEAIDPATVQFTVSGPAGAAPGTAAVAGDGRTATFTPSAPLDPGTTYTVTLSAADPSGNAPPATIWSFTTGAIRPATCPCTVWDDFAVPAISDSLDSAPVELGTKVRFAGRGEVLGVRFYKGAGNSGTHTGSLWAATGERLATGTFTGESATGWQTLIFDQPVAVAANTTYVVSYLAPAGGYAVTPGFFAGSGSAHGAISALAAGVDGTNGVYRYGPGGGFPASSFNSGNYWVDVIYRGGLNGDVTPPGVVAHGPADGATGVDAAAPLTVTFDEPVDLGSAVIAVTDPGGARLSGTATRSADGRTVVWTPDAPLAPLTTHGVSIAIADDNGVPVPGPFTWTFSTSSVACPCSLFSSATVPAVVTAQDPDDYELGVRFTSSTAGTISGVRFYKGPQNTGPHTGSLWDSAGQRLATGTFVDETASGWQTLVFADPVTVLPGARYTASYTTSGFYSVDPGYFQRTGVSTPPLSAQATGSETPNGVYRAGSGHPTRTHQGGNYWVDVLFTPSPDTSGPTVVARDPAPVATDVPLDATISATFDEPVLLAGSSVTVADPGGARLAGTTTVSADGGTLSWVPVAPLAAGTRYTAAFTAADASGNPMSEPDVRSFTTTAVRACPCTLFSAATVPTTVTADDSDDYELGVRFTAAIDGTVTGVRFYKGPGNVGTHTGSLWSASGQLLATGEFVDETASGWQTLTFAAPVPVTAGQVYTASYSTGGFYSVDGGYYLATGVTSPPLSAPASGSDGPNGVYNAGSGFPSATFRGGNYWVDVVFEAGT